MSCGRLTASSPVTCSVTLILAGTWGNGISCLGEGACRSPHRTPHTAPILLVTQAPAQPLSSGLFEASMPFSSASILSPPILPIPHIPPEGWCRRVQWLNGSRPGGMAFSEGPFSSSQGHGKMRPLEWSGPAGLETETEKTVDQLTLSLLVCVLWASISSFSYHRL